jgi:hypothetical protein
LFCLGIILFMLLFYLSKIKHFFGTRLRFN